jgi:hypothetical protein
VNKSKQKVNTTEQVINKSEQVVNNNEQKVNSSSDDNMPSEDRCQYCGKDADGYDFPCHHPICYDCHEEKLEVVKIIPGVCTHLEGICSVCGYIEKLVYDSFEQVPPPTF